MKRHAKAASAGSTLRQAYGLGRIGLASLAVLGFVAFLGSSAPTASAAGECPNAVFRTGPSAKLPECRAYELVSPSYTGGLAPGAVNFFNHDHMFAYPLVTSAGDSVIYQTIGGVIGDFPGSGFTDRYRARRTADGWKTEFIGAKGTETTEPWYGGASSDHEYYFMNAGGSTANGIESEASLQKAFGGETAEYLHKPNGEFELLSKGSLGQDRLGTGYLITPGASHVIFSSFFASFAPAVQLEPNAPPTGTAAIYDRTPGGPTKVVSLLPGDVTPSVNSAYQGASSDGTEVVFSTGSQAARQGTAFYVRVDNTTTKAVATKDDVPVGRELTCTGEPGSAALSYQWLRNGAEIGGATSATYTVVAEDEGQALQCQVTATVASEGTSLRTSGPRFARPAPYPRPPVPGSVSVSGTPNSGQVLTCDPGSWENNPTFTYQWLRNGAEIGGATSATYTVVAEDEGTGVQCRITGTNSGGTTLSYSPPLVIEALAPKATANPTISNITDPGNPPAVGDELSCSDGTWINGPTFAHQWLRDGTEIGAATSATHTTVAADEGKTLQCRVTGTNTEGAAQTVSSGLVADPQPGTAPPNLTEVGGVFGFAAVGNELFCGEGSWDGSPTFAYQWLRNGQQIPGATDSSYVLVAEDRQTIVQCRVTATNAGGSAVAINTTEGTGYVNPNPPFASASLPEGHLSFGGIFGGHVFYSDAGTAGFEQTPADLYSFDIATGATTRITDVGDARFVNVSKDGSHVYFVSPSQIGGEGTAGQPNLYLWSRTGNSITFIASVDLADVTLKSEFEGPGARANLAAWTEAVAPDLEMGGGSGPGLARSRSTPDGSVLVFEATAQLTAFDNTEAAAADCGDPNVGGERCREIYRYDAGSEELSCVSCSFSGGLPSGASELMTFNREGFLLFEPISHMTPPLNVTPDGNMVVFESDEDLLPQDGNGFRDVYRWKEGEGLALISTGQAGSSSHIYSMTPNGSDVVISTGEQLRPEDENRGTPALYDARVDGGFPPPEKTVTEPCSGDACQGSPDAAPGDPVVASSSLSGNGNVQPKARRRCGKSKRAVHRKGRTRCVAKKHHRRAGSDRRAAR